MSIPECTHCGNPMQGYYLEFLHGPDVGKRSVCMNCGQTSERDLVHLAPIADSGLTPCCHRNPMDIPRGERFTTDKMLVTCNTEPL